MRDREEMMGDKMGDNMGDLISRQKAIDALVFDYAYAAADIIKKLPSAQPEVIRCKDCKYFDRYTTVPEKYQWDAFCHEWARHTYENWFCSRGRRKDG